MKKLFFVFFALTLIPLFSFSQMISGTWKGYINKKKVELKIIQKGDSLFGTSYYYESANNYRRFSIKGYFDDRTNETVWWDDQLIEEKTGKSILGTPNKTPYLSSADFNCPGSNKMFLNGKASLPDDKNNIKGNVDLVKIESGIFNDEWNFVIENFTAGANDPDIIDSVANIALSPDIKTEEKVEMQIEKKKPAEIKTESNLPETKTVIPNKEAPIVNKIPETKTPPSIEEKFIQREKLVTVEIPLTGDSIELRFYDNAEIDGDSISLFLNNKLIFQHIRLKASAYTIKLPVNELQEINDLVMVAENLGSIPPNTSYMLAIVNNIRYEAMLKSTEESSAVIRLVKK
jgi:hypothetical protein